jgi:hypothetical protein
VEQADAPEFRESYLEGVATAWAVARERVSIVSIEAATSERRRRRTRSRTLLAGEGVKINTKVTVVDDAAGSVSAAKKSAIETSVGDGTLTAEVKKAAVENNVEVLQTIAEISIPEPIAIKRLDTKIEQSNDPAPTDGTDGASNQAVTKDPETTDESGGGGMGGIIGGATGGVIFVIAIVAYLVRRNGQQKQQKYGDASDGRQPLDAATQPGSPGEVWSKKPAQSEQPTAKVEGFLTEQGVSLDVDLSNNNNYVASSGVSLEVEGVGGGAANPFDGAGEFVEAEGVELDVDLGGPASGEVVVPNVSFAGHDAEHELV